MRILITGAQGQLGQDVVQSAINLGYVAIALPRSRLDITCADSVNQTFDANQPDIVINCAAYTAVDRAEEERDLALDVNRDGPANLATACKQNAIPLVHVSTDYVFDGAKKEAYTETDPLCPVNNYGFSKAAGESEVQKRADRFIILRTAWVFGINGRNFVKTMLRLGSEHQSIRVVDDQVGCPTYTGHLAKAILTIAERCRRQTDFPWGIYHYAGQPPTSWFGFAKAIFSSARAMGIALKVNHLEAIPTSAYPLPAKRALNSRLDCRKFEQVFGFRAASWQEGVNKVVADWYTSRSTLSEK